MNIDPIILAPMEDVTDGVYRRLCRTVGAQLCVTELVGAEQLIAGSSLARRRGGLDEDDRPTAIQIYGADREELIAAARIAEAHEPSHIDINCGCWVPAIAARGAGAGWLRDPTAMVEMARRVVEAVSLPVTVKTRIGWGPESEMPIVDLARRLEDAGVAAIAVHCRTAAVGHTGPADWRWAQRAREVVTIPVIVNGDVRTADDVVTALHETGCAAVMIGRAAIEYPWIFREARARLAAEALPAPPSPAERIAMYTALAIGRIAVRGEPAGIASAKRHVRMLPAELRLAALRATRLEQLLAVTQNAASSATSPAMPT